MSNDNWILILFASVAALFIFAVLVEVPRQRRKAWRAALELASRRGWERVMPEDAPQGWALLRDALAVSGIERDRRVRVLHFTVGSGKSKQHWTALQVDLAAEPPRLAIRQENFFTRLAERLGMKDLKTGDAAFDRRYRLESSDPLFVHALLPEWRQALDSAWSQKLSRAALTVNRRTIAFERQGMPSGKILAEIEPLLPVMLDLADVLEAYTESRQR